MIPVHIKNKFSDHPQKVMRPVSIRLSEEMIGLLKATSEELGFKRIQGLIRLYIRQGLDRDHQDDRVMHIVWHTVAEDSSHGYEEMDDATNEYIIVTSM